MAKCTVCGMDIPHWDPDKIPVGHLVVTKSAKDDHIHVHGDLDNKPLMTELISIAQSECGLDLTKSEKLPYKEFIFHNRQRIGDMLMFTCGVRDFKAAYPDARVGVVGTAMHIWDNNPYVDKDLCISPAEFESLMAKETIKAVSPDRILLKIGPGKMTNSSNRIDWHFANAFRVSIENALGVHIPQGDSRPDIWFTEEEYNAPRVDVRPYWVISVNGELGWGCKMYPFERWQEFVRQNPDVIFYQIGTKEDHPQRLQGDNVVDYVGKTQGKETGIRDLFKLFLNAEGSIGLVSFHMHLSGALLKPAIVVAGAREPVSFTQYAGHRYMASDGALPCGINACWHCDINTCSNLVVGTEKVPKCVDLITPEDLTRALRMYYDGGRLRKDVPSAKPKIKNLVKVATSVVTPEAPKPVASNTDISKYGMEWGGGCITDKDWDFIRETILKYEVKTVLEFGAGLSTLLMNDLAKVTSYETMQPWIDKIKALRPDADIKQWDGKVIEVDPLVHFDMAFVDGPAGGVNREQSTKIASVSADVIIVHDAGRQYEKVWQGMYLQEGFAGPIKGGHRCHLWVRKGSGAATMVSLPKAVGEDLHAGGLQDKVDAPTPAPVLGASRGQKRVKFISTARGWGGCARSITTMMRMLLQAGHSVEFIPFRNSVGSREFQQCLSTELKDVKVSLGYNTIKEHCDVLVVYADDFVWEFKTPEISEVFADVNADRRVMVTNYRRGGIGQIPWTKGWDKYIFLNETQQIELLEVLPGANTRILSPCIDLTEFFRIEQQHYNQVRIVRHNSQGDTKFAKDCGDEISAALARIDLTIEMMPGPNFVPAGGRFTKFNRNEPPIPQFLSKGNLFWYSLPQGYMDAGPRVIIEAMAAGLPVIADNWGGAVDRITPECGWLCNSKEEMIDIITKVTVEELEVKGRAARKRALEEFDANNWIKEIIC